MRGIATVFPSALAVRSARAGCMGGPGKTTSRRGPDLSRSSFRKNVCACLDIAPTSKTTVRPMLMTVAEVEPVHRWIRGCEVAWTICDFEAEAKAFEKRCTRRGCRH